MNKSIAIIPARYQSTRLPGKPLREIGGKALINRVFERISMSNSIEAVYVATDDDRILAHCHNSNIPAFMTSKSHTSGTSRIAEVAGKMDAEVILNVQGDEPFIDFNHLDKLVERIQSGCQVSTLAAPIVNWERWQDPNVVKVVCNEKDQAMYFSRSPIPFYRDVAFEEAWQHLGVYAFKRSVLETISAQKISPIAQWESLEQLSWLVSGITIDIVKVREGTLGIDTAEDLAKAQEIVKSQT